MVKGRKIPGGGSFIIGGLSGVALIGPGLVEFGKSGRLSGVHGSSSFVVLDNVVIVYDVSLQDSLSGDGIVSLKSEVSKLSGPSGDSRVL